MDHQVPLALPVHLDRIVHRQRARRMNIPVCSVLLDRSVFPAIS
jgi:hypothetical protein